MNVPPWILLITRLRLGTDAATRPLAMALHASSIACWDIKQWEDLGKELVRKINSGLAPIFSVKVKRQLELITCLVFVFVMCLPQAVDTAKT